MYKKVLVTAIGSMSSECVIRALHNLGVCVVGTDYYPAEYNPIATECEAFSQMPMASDEGFVRQLLSFAMQQKCTMIWPLTDPEVDSLSSARSVFESVGIRICLPPEMSILLARDKYRWPRKLTGSGEFRTIATYGSYEELLRRYDGRFVAKRISGRSSEGIVFGDTHDRGISPNEFQCGYVFQPYIDGEICTVDFACHPVTREIACVPRVELLRTKNGAGTVVRIETPERFTAAIQYIADRLGLSGTMNCEFIRDRNRDLWLMDINPRFSAGVAFSSMAGYDFTRAHFSCYCGAQLPSLNGVEVGRVFVKRYVEF